MKRSLPLRYETPSPPSASILVCENVCFIFLFCYRDLLKTNFKGESYHLQIAARRFSPGTKLIKIKHRGKHKGEAE